MCRFNRVKDYVTVAGQLAITHLLAFSQTESSLVMKIARFPNGPTLHLKVKNYCLCRHVRASQRRPFESPLLCKNYHYQYLYVLLII